MINIEEFIKELQKEVPGTDVRISKSPTEFQVIIEVSKPVGSRSLVVTEAISEAVFASDRLAGAAIIRNIKLKMKDALGEALLTGEILTERFMPVQRFILDPTLPEQPMMREVLKPIIENKDLPTTEGAGSW